MKLASDQLGTTRRGAAGVRKAGRGLQDDIATPIKAGRLCVGVVRAGFDDDQAFTENDAHVRVAGGTHGPDRPRYVGLRHMCWSAGHWLSLWEHPMPEPDLLTADEAAKLLRIGRRTFDGHVARGDIAYIAVGLGLQRVRKRFDPEDILRFRERQRRVEAPPQITPSRSRTKEVPAVEIIDFKALLDELRAERRVAREAAQKAAREGRGLPRRPI